MAPQVLPNAQCGGKDVGRLHIHRESRDSDLYAITLEEVFVLENWFKPLAKGVVVDVGTYIGKYLENGITVKNVRRLKKS